MLVHAHPDDEVTGTGATMSRYAAAGTAVSLVTCTRGERGEVVDDELAALRDSPDELGRFREGEIAAALAVLGVRDHAWLGGAGRWWDSGMVGTEANADPRAFAAADPAQTTRAMVRLLRDRCPEVVVTYDANGGYGHPDHIAAHRVTMAALDPAADPGYAPELGPPWRVGKVYWTAIRREVVRRLAEQFGRELGDTMPGLADDEITARIDGREWHETKLDAFRAYRSQVDITDGPFAVIARAPEFAVEHYQLVRGTRGPAGPGTEGWEDDLFAGLVPAPVTGRRDQPAVTPISEPTR